MGEVTGELAELKTRFPRLVLLSSLLALAWSEVGETESASHAYEEVAASRFARMPVDSTWLRGITDCAAVCAYLGDSARAPVLSDLLAPYADQMPVGGLGVASGSVAYYVGLLATTLGNFEDAEARFQAAAAATARIDAPAWLARTRLEWARMLLGRREPGDAERARQLLGQAVGTARQLGLGTVERRAAELSEVT
jgi:tetratricopeptide (TPR) repeat protein